MVVRPDSEVIAQQLHALGSRIAKLETRVAEVDRVTGRLEAAALTTARALQEISHHWDAVYEAMRRAEDDTFDESRDERYVPPGKSEIT